MIRSFNFLAGIILAGVCILGANGCTRSVTKLPQPTVHQTVTQEPANVEKKVVFGPLYFDSTKTVLEPDALSNLNTVGAFLLNNPDYNLIIQGYADERGDLFFDKYISGERAKSVYNWLVLYGPYNINEKRVEIQSYGDTRPAQQNCGDDWACHAKNRRVELFAVKHSAGS